MYHVNSSHCFLYRIIYWNTHTKIQTPWFFDPDTRKQLQTSTKRKGKTIENMLENIINRTSQVSLCVRMPIGNEKKLVYLQRVRGYERMSDRECIVARAHAHAPMPYVSNSVWTVFVILIYLFFDYLVDVSSSSFSVHTTYYWTIWQNTRTSARVHIFSTDYYQQKYKYDVLLLVKNS